MTNHIVRHQLTRNPVSKSHDVAVKVGCQVGLPQLPQPDGTSGGAASEW